MKKRHGFAAFFVCAFPEKTQYPRAFLAEARAGCAAGQFWAK
jgi:hypothetical protein